MQAKPANTLFRKENFQYKKPLQQLSLFLLFCYFFYNSSVIFFGTPFPVAAIVNFSSPCFNISFTHGSPYF